MAFLAGQVTETYAGKKDCKKGNHQPNKKGNKCKTCKKKIVKKITKIIINNNTSGGGQTGEDCDVCDELAKINEVTPTWSKKIPAAERFVLVLDDVAVLDGETGLGWKRAPDDAIANWEHARDIVSRPPPAAGGGGRCLLPRIY